MKLLIKSLAFTILFLGAISCGSDDNANTTPDPNVTFTVTLSGGSEVPPNASAATGVVTVTFNTDTKILTLTGTHAGMTATAAHIHMAAAGSNGGVIFPIPTFDSPMSLTTEALDAAQEADLTAGMYYVNVHSALFPGGEIRAQLVME